MVQVVLTIVVLIVLAGVTFLIYRARVNERPDISYTNKFTIDDLGELISQELAEMVRDDDLIITHDDATYQAITNVKRNLAKALDECIYGVEKSKRLVLQQIRSMCEQELPTVEDCKELYDFDDLLYLEPNVQWETLIYFVKKEHRSDCMSYLCGKYGWAEERDILNEVTGEKQKMFMVDRQLLQDMLENEVPKELTHNDMLNVIAIIVYTKRYGFGIVDTLRGLDVDGFNFGTSGSVRYVIDGNYSAPYTTVRSVWIQLRAKWIHFSFLDFYTEEEMKRVVNQLVAWGTTAPMTEKVPYKVNDGYDGARITAVRPPAGECWACFVRKFSAGLYTKEKLLNKPYVHNWELPSRLIYFLMRSEQTTAFTGQQNTGKTSMMKAAMADVAAVNIRILEMSFELAIREIYPWKNVLTVKSTDYVSAEELQDLLKKTDGYLSMVGEVATNIVASRMIQFCLIASAFTMFSHHAKNDFDLVNGLANSLVACGEYENHEVAISTVLDAIKHNVHLDFINGERGIAYISEIIKLDEIAPYPDLTKSNNVVEAIDQLTKIQREFYTRSTDRVRFTSRHIIELNPETMTYEPREGYTPETLRKMCSNLKGKDRADFIKFYRENWGHVLGKSTSKEAS